MVPQTYQIGAFKGRFNAPWYNFIALFKIFKRSVFTLGFEVFAKQFLCQYHTNGFEGIRIKSGNFDIIDIFTYR